MTKIFARTLKVLVATLLVAASASLAWAEKPVGGVTFHERSVAAGIGYSWGKGTLHFKGKNYLFKVNGLSVGEAGAEDVTATGSVYRLEKLTDFNGNYTAAAADLSLGGGGGGIVMQNQNGVVLRIRATSEGIDAKLAVEGLKIQLE